MSTITPKAIRSSPRAAVYSESLVDKIPDHIRSKYMQEFEHEDSTYWRVKETVCKTILFKKLNLVSYPYPIKGPFDIIFCRNVMIYFDVQTRQKIINEFSRLLRPGGVLFLSHSESLVGINHTFRSLNSSVFQKEQL